MIALIMAFEEFVGANSDQLDAVTKAEITRAIKAKDVDALMARGVDVVRISEFQPDHFNGADKLANELGYYRQRVKFRAETDALLNQCIEKGYFTKKKGTSQKSS